ncbi:MAG: hypothetical protein J6C96_12600 [Oscillospiraceae bacterium]|nr:hypothetical protein [Oscillospiraceae bacterium]
MKKEKIYALFRKNAHLKLYNKMYNANGEEKIALQYITDGCACYPLENLPIFNAETLRGLINVDPETPTHYIVEEIPEWWSDALVPFMDGEIPLKKSPWDMFGFTVFETYHNTDNDGFPDICVFVNTKFLAPISDDDGILNYSYRKLDGEKCAVVATDGMIVKAVIMPVIFRKDDIPKKIDFVEMVYRKLMDMQSVAEADDEGEQLEL